MKMTFQDYPKQAGSVYLPAAGEKNGYFRGSTEKIRVYAGLSAGRYTLGGLSIAYALSSFFSHLTVSEKRSFSELSF